MKKHLLIFLAAALPFTLLAQVPKKGPLDGQTYTVDITKDGKKKPMDPDDFKFAAAKFKCKSFENYGFKSAGPYKIASIDSSNASAKVYSWTATMTNDIKDVINWTGTINGEDIEGTSELVTSKGETKFTYTFSGKLKAKPGKK